MSGESFIYARYVFDGFKINFISDVGDFVRWQSMRLKKLYVPPPLTYEPYTKF